MKMTGMATRRADRGDGDERLAHAHRQVVARVLDGVAGLVGGDAQRGDRRGLAHVGAEVQRAVARVVVVGQPALDRADLDVRAGRRSARTAAAACAPVIPLRTGTWLYFANVRLTLACAHRPRPSGTIRRDEPHDR